MKSLILLSAFFLFSANSYSQGDTTRGQFKKVFKVHLANGVSFIRNDAIQVGYETKAAYFFGVGVRVGKPEQHKIVFQVDYNRMKCQNLDSTLKVNQVIPSLGLQLFHKDDFSIRAKSGLIVAIVKDGLNEVSDAFPGFRAGIGLEKKLYDNLIVHFDLDYDVMKFKGMTYRDYDMFRLSIGVYI